MPMLIPPPRKLSAIEALWISSRRYHASGSGWLGASLPLILSRHIAGHQSLLCSGQTRVDRL